MLANVGKLTQTLRIDGGYSMLSRSIVLKVGLCLGFFYVAAVPPAGAQGYSQEQQQLCSNDAFRLCSSDIPDVDRVTACMIRQRAQLSPGCQSVFRPASVAAPVADVEPRRMSRPTNLKPKAAKASKVRKAKKKTTRG